jgi:mRNA-degrading endonuclease RelE of RelBE toxin-antitoxin system
MQVVVQIDEEFSRVVRKLPPDRRESAIAALKKFMRSPELPALKFRPLKRMKDHFIINAHHGDRIILKRIDETTYRAVEVGPHDNVYRRMNR